MINRVYIEITNVCNLSCSFCHKNKRTPQFITLRTFSDILEQTKEITDYIYLHVQGEPLLHPFFEDLMAISDEQKMKVHLVTNGTLLCRRPNLLSHPSLRKVSVSLQSAAFQDPAALPAYMETIGALIEAASEKKSPYVELRFWRSDELTQASDQFCLSWLKDRYHFAPTDRAKSYRIQENVFVSFANDFTWPVASSQEGSVHGTCLGTRKQIAILVDGTVVPCCLDADGAIPLGNVQDTTLSEILNSQRCSAMRNGFQNGIITESLCKACTYRLRFDR